MSERNQKAQHLAEQVVAGGIVQKATERLVYQIVEVCAEHERENTEAMRARVAQLEAVLLENYDEINALRARVAELEAALEWRRVNDEPFEYAIHQGQHGDEFIRTTDGVCLRRAALKDEPESPARSREGVRQNPPV